MTSLAPDVKFWKDKKILYQRNPQSHILLIHCVYMK
jgi:hypothetical protein